MVAGAAHVPVDHPALIRPELIRALVSSQWSTANSVVSRDKAIAEISRLTTCLGSGEGLRPCPMGEELDRLHEIGDIYIDKSKKIWGTPTKRIAVPFLDATDLLIGTTSSRRLAALCPEVVQAGRVRSISHVLGAAADQFERMSFEDWLGSSSLSLERHAESRRRTVARQQPLRLDPFSQDFEAYIPSRTRWGPVDAVGSTGSFTLLRRRNPVGIPNSYFFTESALDSGYVNAKELDLETYSVLAYELDRRASTGLVVRTSRFGESTTYQFPRLIPPPYKRLINLGLELSVEVGERRQTVYYCCAFGVVDDIYRFVVSQLGMTLRETNALTE